MVDQLATTMADVLGKEGPALSATSDMPQPKDDGPPLSVEVNKGAEVENAETEAPVETAETVEQSAEEAQPAPKKKPGVQERFSELTAERRADKETIRQQAEAIAALTQRQVEEKVAAAADPKPSREQYNDPQAYDAANDAWHLRDGERRGREAATREATDKAVREQQNTIETNFQERVAKVREEMPDFDEVALSPDVKITDVMAASIKYVDKGPQLAYYLGKNPAEAARIAALPNAQQIYEMGKLEAKLTVTQSNVSRAPRPITTLGSRERAVAKSPNEESMDEYATRRTAELRGNRAGMFGNARAKAT